MNDRELIRALRCTATPYSKCRGEKCPYGNMERLEPEVQKAVGRGFWFSCDVDRIALEAADRLEKLLGGEPDG